MKLRSLVWITMLVVAITPASAFATACRDWNRLSEPRKWDRIDRLIRDTISGPQGRSYQVNRGAIERCLLANTENMYWDFNDLCENSSTANSTAIRVRFKQYIWTCVN